MLINTLFKKHRDILDKLPVGIVITTQEGKIIEFNEAILKMVGYSEEEFLKLTTHDLYCNIDDRNKVYQKMYIDNSGTAEILVKRKDNSNFWARATYVIHKSMEEGIYCLSVVEDITELKEAEQFSNILPKIVKAIVESDDFYSAIEITLQKVCESTDWACGEAWIPSGDGTYLEQSNIWYCNIKGMKKFEEESNKYKFPPGVGLPGLAWSSKKPEWMDDITLDDNFPRRHLAIKSGLESAVAIPILADNKVIAVMVFLTTKVSIKKDERMIGLISIIASQLGILFQKKQMENLLQKSETTLKNIIESVPLGIAVTTPEGMAVEANPAILRMLGYDSKEEILKIPLIKLYRNPYDRERLIRMLQEDGFVRDFEVQLIRKDGALIWCKLNAVAEKSKIRTRFIFSVDDITKDIQREEIYLLQTLTQAIVESKDFSSALEVALKKICISADWDCGEVWIPSGDGTYLEYSNWYCNIEGMERFKEESNKFRFLKGVGLHGLAWSSQKPEWITDVTFNDNFPQKQIAIEAGFKSAVAIPILADNKVIAVMVFLSKEIKRDVERMIRPISVIASQLGVFFNKKQFEDKLQKTTASFSNAQRIAHIGNWEWNIVRNELFWSEEIYHIFGLKPKQFVATYEAFLNSVHPEDREFVKESVNKALYENVTYSIDHRVILPDGSVRIVHEQAEVIFDTNNKPIQMNGTVHDITEYKQMEERFRKLYYAIEQSTLSILITDTKGNIEYTNQKIFDITGYTREEAIGKNPRIFKSGKTPPETYRDMWKTILSGKDWHGEFINKKKNGELFYERATISPIRNYRGVLTNFVAYKEDITKVKQLEEQLHQSQKMEAIGQLTGGIAHDFNNILTGIILNSELLKLKIGKDNPLRAHAEQVSEQALKAANLIQSLLAFSRKQAINLQYTNLKDIIISTKRLLSRIIREDIELKINVPEKELMIMGDSVQIEHVIINLATNARDAMPNGGVLTIEAQLSEIDDKFIKTHSYGKAGKYALMTVTDTGIGMDENIQKKIFEPFFTTKEAGKGTGLGLAMVYGTIKQHEGFIDLYSKPGNGTTFRIYLPIKEPTDEDIKPIQEVISIRGNETVLVVEDDEVVREIILKILINHGYTVIEAKDGDDALEKFIKNKDRIKLLLLDVIIPKKSGKEVYDAIQNISSKVKVLFMSGYTGDTMQVKEIIENGLNVVSKPFTDKEILKEIRKILNGNR